MKEKEEDEERNENICPQTLNQSLNSKAEATLILCGLWIVGERANNCMITLIHCLANQLDYYFQVCVSVTFHCDSSGKTEEQSHNIVVAKSFG